ncbi:hypothetical protein AOQ84DRAFT_285851, partial [Glonium stellatum]
NTLPRGFTEFQDLDSRHYSEDASIPAGNKMAEFLDHVAEACEAMGRTANVGPRLKGWMEEAGFANVREVVVRLPFGMWPREKRMKQIGALNYLQFEEGMEAFSLGLFTRVLGWSVERVQLYLVDVRKDMRNKDMHMLFNYYVVWGQRLE